MKRVLLGMSGGVDSSVAAIVLLEQGYEVIGATMKLWESEDENKQSKCCGDDNILDAKKVCDKLGIPHYTLNLKEEFQKCVIDSFIEGYANAITPNPCIECNKFLKFNYFFRKALELNCDYIATGHYAKTEFSKKYNQYVLKKSNAGKKDQSYVLYNIPKNIIGKVLFPLGNFENKEQIREIAKQHGLLTAKKPDSQEICFIPDDDYAGFLIKTGKVKSKPGYIVNKEGNILGTHKGLIYYTIGQRKGLGISNETPLYVIDLDIKNNRLIVGKEEDIYSKILYAKDLNFTVDIDKNKPIEVQAKIRYSAKEGTAVLYPEENGIARVEFNEPQRAITRGQSVVFYIDDVLIGGGKIIWHKFKFHKYNVLGDIYDSIC